MQLRRTTAPSALALLVFLALVGGAAAHAPSQTQATPPKRIVFPVVGKTHYQDDFGAPRPQGSHEATDIMADWRAPLVAAEAGKVRIWTRSARAGCMLYLDGRSGTTYLYIHLNNDLTPRNDNRGGCRKGVAFAPGLADGQMVQPGQLLGYVGDSGDANGIHPHVHFELHPGGGSPVSPYPWLRRSPQPLFPVPGDREARALPVAITLIGIARAAPAEPARLSLRVRRVRLAGVGYAVDRTVVVSVPEDAALVRPDGTSIRLEEIDAGSPVRVVSVPTLPTRTAQLAAPGVLEAAVVRAGKPPVRR